MISFKNSLNAEDAEAIRSFLTARANELKRHRRRHSGWVALAVRRRGLPRRLRQPRTSNDKRRACANAGRSGARGASRAFAPECSCPWIQCRQEYRAIRAGAIGMAGHSGGNHRNSTEADCQRVPLCSAIQSTRAVNGSYATHVCGSHIALSSQCRTPVARSASTPEVRRPPVIAIRPVGLTMSTPMKSLRRRLVTLESRNRARRLQLI